VIDATVHSDNFNHSEFVSQKCKDAIVDQFRERTGQRPSIDKVHPDLRINIHIDKDQVSVALDTSGNSLHQRGYGTATNIAPINEVWQQVFCCFRVGTDKVISWIQCVVQAIS
jgi:putative N6-adenine-specific DNA methylase